MTSAAPGAPRPRSGDPEWDWSDDDPGWVPPAIDTSRPSSARIYDYLLGGKDNFEVDRAAAEHLLTVAPYVRDMARANREFMHRAVRHMVRDLGIHQFVDLGTGIPTSPSVHEVARAEADGVRVVYVDNDPVVLAHNRAVLATDPGTLTLLRDLREPDTVVDDPQVKRLIDFDRPVGLLLVSVLHFVPVDVTPPLLARYRDALAPGSAMAASILCRDRCDPDMLRVVEAMYEHAASQLHPRTTAQIEQLF
jgi:hypothetical protein